MRTRAIMAAIGLTGLLAAHNAHAATWTVPDDFPTIDDALQSSSVADGDTIRVGAGSHAGAYVSKRVEIKGMDGAKITSGPMHPAGLVMGFRLLAGSDGTTISHLTFDGIDLAIMNGAAVDDVTVTQCKFSTPIQAISNWAGSRWNITHNVVTDLRARCGGGIGILVADRFGGVVSDNVVAHNKISGTLHVDPDDCGGYQGSGIVFYSDFRSGFLGSLAIEWNRVVKNSVSLVSDNPGLVDVVAFELTDLYQSCTAAVCPSGPVVLNNAIGFNDFRGSTHQIVLSPQELDQENKISRNFGENRGQGLHPKLFGPNLTEETAEEPTTTAD